MMPVMLRLVAMIAALVALQFTAPASAAERRFAIQDFDRIIVEGPFAVRLTTGRSTSAAATGSNDALNAVSVEVQGMTLRIRRDSNAWTSNPNRPVEPATIVLTTRNLRSARVVGSGQLDIAGLSALRADLVVQGTGRLRATGIDADNLSVGLAGSGSIELAGTAETFTADIQGSGSLLAPALSAETATVSANTTGDVALAARRTATVNALGLGQVEIGGNPACTVRGANSGQVRCGAGR